MLNHLVIMGRLTRDPELRETPSGVAICNFTIACDRDYADKATGDRECDFIDVAAWRGLGEFVNKHFAKGRMAVVCGRIQSHKWTDKDGNNRSKLELVAENVYFGDTKKFDNQAAPAAQIPKDYPELPDDGPLPFDR